MPLEVVKPRSAYPMHKLEGYPAYLKERTQGVSFIVYHSLIINLLLSVHVEGLFSIQGGESLKFTQNEHVQHVMWQLRTDVPVHLIVRPWEDRVAVVLTLAPLLQELCDGGGLDCILVTFI